MAHLSSRLPSGDPASVEKSLTGSYGGLAMTGVSRTCVDVLPSSCCSRLAANVRRHWRRSAAAAIVDGDGAELREARMLLSGRRCQYRGGT